MPRTFQWMMIVAVAMTLATASCREQSREEALAEGAKLTGEGNAKGAVVIYKNLLERNPEDTQARFELAKAYLTIGKPDQAGKEAQRLAAIPNPPEGAHLLLGKSLVAQGKAEEALKELSDFLATHPDSAEAWEFVGRAQARNKDLPKAADAYEHSLSLDPGRTMARIELAATRLGQNKLPEAQVQVDALLAANPNNQVGLHLLAQIQAMNNDVPAVIATYETIIAKYPKDMKARYDEAFILLATQGVSEKVERAAKALTKDFPNQPEGYKLQGLLDLAQGASAQAVTNFERALRLRSEIETHFFLAQAYERNGSLEMATSELRVVLDNSPPHVKARLMLAGINLRMNRSEEAIAELKKLLQLHPDNDAGKLMLGDIYLARKDFAKSLVFYKSIPEGVEQSAAAHLKTGIVMTVTGKPDQAEAELRAALRQSPNYLEARLALAAILNKQQRLDEALAVLDLAGLSPADAAQASTAKAAMLSQQGRAEDAVAMLEKAKSLDPNLAAAYYALAKIYNQKLEPDKALEQYRQLLAHQPQSPGAHAALAAGLEYEGKLEEARQHLEQATESKQLGAYLDLAGFLSRRNKNDEALKVLGQCLQEHSKSLPALVALARVQSAMGDEANSLATLQEIEAIDREVAISERLRQEIALTHWDQAETVAAKFIELKPASAGGYLALASVKMRRDDLPGAERILRQALDVDKSSIGARLELGALLMKLGRTQEAASSFEEAIAKSAKPAEAYAARGLAWQTAGNTDAAVKDYEAALRLQNNMPLVLNNLSMIYSDKPSLAAKGLEYAISANALMGNNPLVLDTLGYALLKNGRQQDATIILQHAAALAPKSEDIAKHLGMATAIK